jgi:predicted dehydrogenase
MSLEAGKHCIVEKPFAMNAREAAELAALAESKGLFLMEAMWTACLPATIEALRMVAAGEIGELQSASASVGGVWYSEDDLANEAERAAAKALGSGVLLDVGCYAIAVPFMFYKQMGISDELITLRSSVGSLCAGGADISGTHTLSYGSEPERTAVAHCSWRYMLPNEVVLYGTKGILTLNSVWGATEISVSGPAMHPGEPERDNEVKQVGYEPPAAGAEGKWSGDTAWRSGMAHEIREAEACIAAGKTQSDKWPLSATLKMMELMDDSRKLMGKK